MSKVPREYRENYKEDYLEDYPIYKTGQPSISNEELKNLILNNKATIEQTNKMNDEWKSELKSQITELKSNFEQLREYYTDIKSDIKEIKKDSEWYLKDYSKLASQIQALEKKSDRCPVCNEKVDIEELSKMTTECRSSVQSLQGMIEQMRDTKKEITANTIAWVAIIVSVVTSIFTVILGKFV